MGSEDANRAPVVAGDTVYVVDDEADKVFALDTETGETRWVRAVGNIEATASPAVTEDTLYLAAGPTVVGLDTGDGTERFRVRVPGSEPDAFALANGTLFVGSGRFVSALRERER